MYLPFPGDLPPGAFHAAEVPYLFRDPQFQAASPPTSGACPTQMLRYWANFAPRRRPNDADLPPWPPFDAARPVPARAVPGPGPGGIGPVDYAAEHQLDFWSGLP